MKKIMDSHQFKTWLSFLLLAVAVIVIFHIVAESATIFGWIGFFFSAISPFIWGFIIAYVLNIPREGIEKLLVKIRHPLVERRKRGFSVLLTYIGFVVLVVILYNVVVPQIYESIVDFVAFLPTLVVEIERFLLDLDDVIPFLDWAAIAESFSLEEILGGFGADNVAMAINTLTSFVGSVFSAALALISSAYFLLEGDKIRVFVARLLKAFSPRKFYDAVMKYGREINFYVKRYIFCQVLDALIFGSLMTIVLSLMGINYAFVLGPLLGFANLVPYFGSIVATVIAIIVIFLTDGTQMGLIATVVLLVMQQFDANFIFPRLLGGSMKMPPLIVIIGIVVGLAYYGILGMMLSIPILTVLRNILEDILRNVEAKKQIGKEVLIDEDGK